jgi:hypothetical protein
MLISSATKTLGINAAFLQEIKDSHPDLAHALTAVRDACRSECVPSEAAKALVRKLDDLRDCLALQFALEESYGYMEGICTDNAAIAESAEKARGQHCSLYLEISSLCERAEDLQFRGFAGEHVRELIAQTEKFDLQLTLHERLESELIEKAYRAQHRA